ncbi:virulence factor [Halofilum ochraceum]|uniref:virulence factor n=1 Tax=Halofilum ochraceum TaxID=1611323 RepID=UPI0008DAD69A|nr:virulence factor [Halofilum ochraceum]
MAAKLITVYWRDIPAQVIAKKGRESAKVMLSARFQEAIDRAAMRAGKGGSDAYMSEWRRDPQECGDDLQGEVDAAADRIEKAWSDDDLDAITRNRGHAHAQE